jgi:competence protein ComEC
VRLSVRRGTAPPAGAFVEAKAQLNPPLQPLRPGSYDFARDLYFQRLGASGFVHGAVKVVTPPAEAGWRLRAVTFVEGVRDAIDMRIRSVLSGDVGSIASALITGKCDAITPYLYDAMFVSGIGHVLSISGYHMAVVAGVPANQHLATAWLQRLLAKQGVTNARPPLAWRVRVLRGGSKCDT